MTENPPPPARFRSAVGRNARIGRLLRLVARLRAVDDEVLTEIGAGLLRRDEPAAALVRAMNGDDPRGRVTMRQFQTALAHGIASVPDAPPALTEFFALVDTTPSWVDADRVERGAAVLTRLGKNASDVLLALALIGGYRFGGPPDLLVATGGLTGDSAKRRLAETQHWTMALARPGGLGPGGEGRRLSIHVRVMHALVDDRFERPGRWDVATWGLPVNQADQAATLGLFNAVLLLGVRLLGVRVTRAESDDFMHLWRYVGWLMGVEEQWLRDDEREQHRLNYHFLLTQADVTAAGPELTDTLVRVQTQLNFRRFPRLRRWYARRRLSGLLQYFLGRAGMRALGQRPVIPWTVVPTVTANLIRYRIFGHTAAGRRRQYRWGERVQADERYRYFGDGPPGVGRLAGKDGTYDKESGSPASAGMTQWKASEATDATQIASTSSPPSPARQPTET